MSADGFVPLPETYAGQYEIKPKIFTVHTGFIVINFAFLITINHLSHPL